MAPELTDGVVLLSAFLPSDVAAHIAGEDDDVVRWLTGGQASTVASTTAWAEDRARSWASGGSQRMLALREVTSGRLAGMVEANLDHASCGLAYSEANLSYAVQSWARGRGYAVRGVELLCGYLAAEFATLDTAVLRIDPENHPSLRIARNAGFVDDGWTTTPGGERLRIFRRRLRDG